LGIIDIGNFIYVLLIWVVATFCFRAIGLFMHYRLKMSLYFIYIL